MSSYLEVYPTTDFYPVVDEIREQTEECLGNFINQRGIKRKFEIKAELYVEKIDSYIPLPTGIRWEKGMSLRFQYWVGGEVKGYSWPYCGDYDWGEVVSEAEAAKSRYPPGTNGYLYELTQSNFGVPISEETLDAINRQDHFWSDRGGRRMISYLGTSFHFSLIAQATGGRMITEDGWAAWKHNGETPEDFLSWYPDKEFSSYFRFSYEFVDRDGYWS